ncbi:hypothetical protein ECH7EC4486_5694 [Escherichia coli O157:H7 str. EC4486]|nr:hypothetical protein ECH7EC4486_5694 [Escherichia coli O157:H7 str. EC4486]EIP47976.1 hypothetical protein ECEC4402_6076 [Escherichia coli EC4402]
MSCKSASGNSNRGRFFLRLFFVNVFGNVPVMNKKQPDSTLKIFISQHINSL